MKRETVLLVFFVLTIITAIESKKSLEYSILTIKVMGNCRGGSGVGMECNNNYNCDSECQGYGPYYQYFTEAHYSVCTVSSPTSNCNVTSPESGVCRIEWKCPIRIRNSDTGRLECAGCEAVSYIPGYSCE